MCAFAIQEFEQSAFCHLCGLGPTGAYREGKPRTHRTPEVATYGNCGPAGCLVEIQKASADQLVQRITRSPD